MSHTDQPNQDGPKGLIYAIWFPTARDRSVYIGLTQDWRFDKRQGEHLSCAKRQENRIVYKWMNRRMQDGHDPSFIALETPPLEEASSAEIEWQQHFETCGWTPKHQKGGDQQIGYEFTEEHKAKLSEAAKNRPRTKHTERTRQRMAEAWDEERHQKHLEQVRSESHRQAVAEGLKKAYATGKRKSNSPLPFWTCSCGRKMRMNGKTQHERACKGDNVRYGPKKDISGRTYNMLTVLHYTEERSPNGSVLWLCKCKCGNFTKTYKSQLEHNRIKSCGCLTGISRKSNIKKSQENR